MSSYKSIKIKHPYRDSTDSRLLLHISTSLVTFHASKICLALCCSCEMHSFVQIWTEASPNDTDPTKMNSTRYHSTCHTSQTWTRSSQRQDQGTQKKRNKKPRETSRSQERMSQKMGGLTCRSMTQREQGRRRPSFSNEVTGIKVHVLSWEEKQCK